MVSKQRGERFEKEDVASENKPAYEMISPADTIGVYQIESRVQTSVLARIQPSASTISAAKLSAARAPADASLPASRIGDGRRHAD